MPSFRIGWEPFEPNAWRPDEVRVDTMRASGPGGQHVNKTETAVRATHLPSGLSATAQERASQHQNKQLALARLQERVRQQMARCQAEHDRHRWDQHNQLERGNAVRVFKGRRFKCPRERAQKYCLLFSASFPLTRTSSKLTIPSPFASLKAP